MASVPPAAASVAEEATLLPGLRGPMHPALANAVTSVLLALGVLERSPLSPHARAWAQRTVAQMRRLQALLPQHPHEAWVLVVEDQAPLRGEVVDAVAQAGQLMRVAHDGAQALALARTQAPTLLLTNLLLPKLSCSRLVEQLRERFPRAVLPVVFTSNGPLPLLQVLGERSSPDVYSRAGLVALVDRFMPAAQA